MEKGAGTERLLFFNRQRNKNVSLGEHWGFCGSRKEKNERKVLYPTKYGRKIRIKLIHNLLIGVDWVS